jgi:glycerate 2-kinase
MTMLWTDGRARSALHRIFQAAVLSADSRSAVKQRLPARPIGRCVVVGAGKASAAMAAGLDAAWPDVDVSGVVVTRYGHAVPAGRIEILEAAHPIPDGNSKLAAIRMLEAVRGLSHNDLVIALMSGGGSALATAPAAGMTLADKQEVNRALLTSGATITEMNVVRKQLSAIKGGRLALACRPARVVTLVVSDIPGDDASAVGSGPTLPDTSTNEDARAVVERYGLILPGAAREVLKHNNQAPDFSELFSDVRMIATPALALKAAGEAARHEGLTPLNLGDAIEGEACEVGIVMAGIARSIATYAQPVAPPAVLISGGETTVTLGNAPRGRGGRNTEFLLGLAVALNGNSRIWALAGDSDGIDGTEDAAGALVTPDTLKRGRSRGLDARTKLLAHDSYTFFQSIGDLVQTGPTMTNVNDIRAVLITPMQ